MTRIYHILLYLWQLPQNLLGLLFLLRLGGPSRAACVTRREDVRYFYYDAFPGGVTLGNYVFLSTVFRTSTRDVNHEWGHVRDSRLLGPLYLPVIGIPLPFLSYGGSSMLAFTIMLAIFVKQDANRLNVL